MTERASAVQAGQIGIETTPGTRVNASKRLLSVGFKVAGKQDTRAEMSQGVKVATGVSVGRNWTEGSLDGYLGYNDIAYLLSSLLCATTPTGATDAQTWTFTPAMRSQDTPKTFTLQHGDPTTRHLETNYNVVTDLSIEWTKEGLKVGGSFMGRGITDLTGALDTATDVINLVAQPGDTEFYLDADSADFGTTRLARVIKAKLDIKGRWSPAFFADSSQDSYGTIVEKGLTSTLTMTIAADAVGMGLLSQYREGALIYPRMRVLGPDIGGDADQPYSFTVDLAGRITKAFDGLEDSDGIYAYDLEVTGVLDPDWGGGVGRSLRAVVVNALTAL